MSKQPGIKYLKTHYFSQTSRRNGHDLPAAKHNGPRDKLPPVPPHAPPIALPVVAGDGGEPFIISIGSQDGEAGLYWLLAFVDALVLCAAAGMVLWLAPAV